MKKIQVSVLEDDYSLLETLAQETFRSVPGMASFIVHVTLDKERMKRTEVETASHNGQAPRPVDVVV